VASATYAWTGPSSYTSSLEDPTRASTTIAHSGTYNVTVTVNGCTSSAGTTNVTVNPIPTTPTAGSNSPVCEGSTINLTANTVASATYAWTGPSSFTSSSEDPTRASSTTAHSGTYSVTVTVNGCTSAAGTTNVTVNPIPATPTAGSNSPICAGSTLNLTANTVASATYAWTGPSSFTSSLEDPTRASTTTAHSGTYNVTVTVNGCTSSAGTTNVTVNPIPTTPTAGSNSPVCEGSTINLTANTVASATYAWTGPASFTSSSEDPTRASSTTAHSGTYSVTVTLNGCTSVAGTTTVTVNTIPAATITTSGAALQYCAGGSGVTLTATAIASATYEWFLGGVSQGAASASNTRANSVAGNWTVKVSLSGCSATSTAVTVSTVAATTITTPPANVGTCAGSNAAFNIVASGTGLTYQWYKSPSTLLTNGAKYGGVTTSSLSLTGVAAGDAGNYYAIISSTGPCPAVTSTTASLTITATETPTIAVASSTSQVCTGSSVTFTATGGGTGTTPTYVFYDAVTNTPLTGGTQSNPDPTQSTYTKSLTATTGVYVILTSTSTCLAGSANVTSNTVNVTVDQNPTTSVAGTTSSICASGTTLAGNNPTVGTGKWTQVGTTPAVVTFANDGLYNTGVSGLTAAGDYVFQWTISNGSCTASSSNVTIKNVGSVTTPLAGNDATICQTQTTYTLAANAAGTGETGTWTMVSSSTSGTVSFGGANSASSTASFSQAGVYTLRWTITNGICSPSPSDDVIITVDATPTASVAGTAASICASSTTLAGNNPTVGTGKWTQVGTTPAVVTFTNDGLYNTGVSGLTAAGDYVFQWTISNGACTASSSNVTIKNVGSVTTPTAGNDATICETAAYTLAANAANVGSGETGTWTMVSSSTFGTVTFGGGNSANSTASFSQAGVYTLRWTISNGVCLPSPSDDVIITVEKAADNTLDVSDLNNVCQGNAINLTVFSSQVGVKYQAYIGGIAAGTQVDGNGSNLNVPISASALAAGINNVVIKAVGCNTTDLNEVAVVNVLGTANLSISGVDNVCGGESAVPYSINPVAGATSYIWTSDNGVTVSSGSSNTLANFSGITGARSNISVKPSIGSFTCGTVSKTVTWLPSYNGTTIRGKEPFVCVNETIFLDLINTNASEFTFRSTSTAGVQVTEATTAAVFKFTQSGVYTLVISPVVSPCAANPANDSIVTVTVVDPPIANAGDDDLLDSYATVNLNGSGSSTGSGITYTWSSPSANPGISNPNIITTTATPKALQTTYFLEVKNAAGCTSMHSKEVIIDLQVETPNVFSPNGDGIHDRFDLPNIEIFPKAVLYIYNQWGEQIFKSQPGYTNPWDGRRGNAECTIGTYYYILELNADGQKPITGAVTIVK
jgi:gliding motility-associated-like protein